MAICAGELDRRITIQSFTESVNDFREKEKTWSDFVSSVPAKREHLSGGEQFDAAEKSSQVKVRFKIRWMNGVTKQMRIVEGSDIYDIEEIEEVDRRRGLLIYVVGYPGRG
jgi:SPP1 family predicted phage head-tail adaptor